MHLLGGGLLGALGNNSTSRFYSGDPGCSKSFGLLKIERTICSYVIVMHCKCAVGMLQVYCKCAAGVLHHPFILKVLRLMNMVQTCCRYAANMLLVCCIIPLYSSVKTHEHVQTCWRHAETCCWCAASSLYTQSVRTHEHGANVLQTWCKCAAHCCTLLLMC